MDNVTIELDLEGVRSLLRSKEMKEICEQHAKRALSRLGNGYVVTSMTGKNRVNASIYAESRQAKQDNLDNDTILKALRG
jgi:hypothetical protein